MPRLARTLARLPPQATLARAPAAATSIPRPTAASTSKLAVPARTAPRPTIFTALAGLCLAPRRAPALSRLSLASPTTALPALPAHLALPTLPALSALPARAQQLRAITYGREYQPSQRKRKRKHGFLARAKGGRLGRKLLSRRRAKGRRFLSH